MVLKILLFLPLSGAALVAVLPRSRPGLLRGVALSVALLALLVAGYLVLNFDPSRADMQFYLTQPWNQRVGSNFALGVDGISLPMVVLATLLSLIAVGVSSSRSLQAKLYYALVLVLETAMLGVFMARDWALFYVFWEFTLIPLFFLIDRLGGENRQRAALNFVIYTMGGSVFMLVALLLLYDAAPGHSFAMADMASGGQRLPPGTQLLIFCGLLVGFGVKMPIVPLHGWLPLAHVEAPSPVSILLSGVLLKMGSYGLIRAVETLPGAALAMHDWLAALAFVSMLYGGILAWNQRDLKSMVAYSSVAHMGVVLLGIASLDVEGFQGAVFQMVSHGLAAAALFLLVGLLYVRSHTRDIADYGSLHTTAPRFAFFMALSLLASVGLPGSAGFIAELHALIGGFHRWGGWMLLLSLAMLVSAAYALRTVARLSLGERPMALEDMSRGETLMASVLCGGIVFFGCFPAPLLNLAEASVLQLASLFRS